MACHKMTVPNDTPIDGRGAIVEKDLPRHAKTFRQGNIAIKTKGH